MQTNHTAAQYRAIRSLLIWAISQLTDRGILTIQENGRRWGEVIQADGTTLTEGDVVHELTLFGNIPVQVRMQPTTVGGLSIHVGATFEEKPIYERFEAEDVLGIATLYKFEGACRLNIAEKLARCPQSLASKLVAMNAHATGYFVNVVT